MAKQDTARATQEMPEAHVSKREASEEHIELAELVVGDVVENRRLDGSTVQDRFLGSVDVGGQTKEVVARTEGDRPRIRTGNPQSTKRSLSTALRVQLYGDATKSAARSAVKAEGLKGDVAQSILEEIEDDEGIILAEAAGTSDPEKAIVKAVTNEVKAIATGEEIERPTLQQLTEQLREINDQIEASLDDNSPKGQKLFQRLSQQEQAIRLAIFDRRTQLEPDMDDEDLILLADEVDGFVEPTPDALYKNGEQAIKDRIQTVFEQLADARKKNDGEALIRLSDEMARHEVALALMKQQPETLEEILGDADITEVLTTPPPLPKETAADRLIADVKKEERQLEVMKDSPFALKQQVKNEKGETVEVAHVYPPDHGVVRILVRGGKDKLAILTEDELAKLNGMEITDLADEDLELVEEPIETADLADEEEHPPELEEDEEEKQEREQAEQQFMEVLMALKAAGTSAEAEGLPTSFDAIQKMKASEREAAMDRIRDLHYTYIGQARKATKAGYLKGSGKRLKDIQPGTNEPIIKHTQEMESGMSEWQKKYNELMLAVSKNEQTAESVGLPDSFEKIMNMNAQDQKEALDTLSNAYSEYISRGRKATEAGFSRVSGRREGREFPASPIEELDESDIEEVETEPTPVSDEMKKNYPDLVQKQIFTSAEDLHTWENTYYDLLYAMKAHNAPELEGMPEDFQDVLNTKDDRGFFGKLFRRPSKRVQMFKKIQELQLSYQVPKSTDMSKRTEQQKTRAQEQARAAAKTGGGSKAGV